ncbi:relaxase/mobilization nuclease domain-containing protein [Croceivirga radicis]|uniref:relaxase/mobilization nuclease domain-containing protein n=1 Tax=Croceivirga radicis TaxID=1929488 RepID=UPI0002DB0D85|nr:relaxase/mobilization nuclease domain-containing protein [Croceivirga radicis]
MSFVISPTITDGKKLSVKDLNKITNEFIIQMKLENRHAIAFVHRNKAHTHIHLDVNRVDLEGKAFNDSFIGKVSQRAAHVTAEKLGLTTVAQVQFENKWHSQEIRNEIKRRHDLTINYQKPEDLTKYTEGMRSNGVVVNPVVNKSGQLQGFHFFFNGQQFKGSAVHRKMGVSYLLKSIALDNKSQDLVSSGNTIKLFNKLVPIPQKLALTISQQNLRKKSMKKGIGI